MPDTPPQGEAAPLAEQRKSEERFRSLVLASSYVVYRMSPDWSEMWQLEGRGFIADTEEPSRNWLETYIHPDDQEHFLRAINEAVRTKSIFELEHRVRRVDGSLGWTLSRAVPLLDDAGNILEWFGTASDVTERKQAEALTECQRHALQMLAEGAALDDVLAFLLGVIERHADSGMLGSILLLNEAGTHFERGIGPRLPDAFNKAVEGIAVASAIGVCCHAVARREAVSVPDFSAEPQWSRFVEFVAPYDLRAGWSTPIFGSGGKVLGTFANYYRQPCDPAPRELAWVDVVTRTAAIAIERAQADAALRDSEEQFRTLANEIPQLAWMANPDGWIFWYNRGWYDYTGTTAKQMEGWGWQSVHDPDMLPTVLERWRASIATGTRFEMVFPLKGADGVFRPFLTRIAPVRGGDGRITRWFGSNTDISGQREIQDTLRRLTETLERELETRSRALEAEMAERRRAEAALQQSQRLEAIGQLTGGVAHDFNNLLTVIVGHAEGIAATAQGNPPLLRMAAAILRAAERGARLTSQLLAFSRRQKLRPITVTVDRLLANFDDLVRRAVGEAIDLELRGDEALWPVLVDAAQFESAILNLVINARDAMPDGGRIVIAARNSRVFGADATRLDLAPGEYVTVSVTDTGTGMQPHVREHAFEPFFTTKDVGKGTGLGLAQIYGFAKQSGGAATIESTIGSGTTVSLYLPRAEAPRAEDEPSAKGAAHPAGRGKTVLLVEDQPEVRDVIEASLQGMGYRVLAAPDGVAAQKILEGDDPIDLLLTDVVMPNGVSGIGLAEAARRLRQDLKIVLVSGYARDEGRAGSVPEEFVFLEKPFRQDELANAVAAAFNGGTEAAE